MEINGFNPAEAMRRCFRKANRFEWRKGFIEDGETLFPHYFKPIGMPKGY